jgi:hypothetical protein
MTTGEWDRVKEIRQYAWDWFSYHAEQRTSMFNYFLAAAALLVAGFASAVSSRAWPLALAIAFVGLAVSSCFIKLDKRNEELVGLGKDGLLGVEAVLFRDGGTVGSTFSGVPFPIGITAEDQQRDTRKTKSNFQRGKHSIFLRMIELIVLGAFLIAALVAGFAWKYPAGFEDKKQVETADLLREVKTLEKETARANAASVALQSSLVANSAQVTTDFTGAIKQLEEGLCAPGNGKPKRP